MAQATTPPQTIPGVFVRLSYGSKPAVSKAGRSYERVWCRLSFKSIYPSFDGTAAYEINYSTFLRGQTAQSLIELNLQEGDPIVLSGYIRKDNPWPRDAKPEDQHEGGLKIENPEIDFGQFSSNDGQIVTDDDVESFF